MAAGPGQGGGGRPAAHQEGPPLLRPITDLKLTAEQRDALGERMAALTAINVYRQLREAESLAQAAGQSLAAAGSNIITNCCSSSKME